MPEWNRKCPLGVPLIVHILTLAGPDPFLRAVVGVDQGGSDFRDFGVHSFLLSSISVENSSCGIRSGVVAGYMWVFFFYFLLLDSRFFLG